MSGLARASRSRFMAYSRAYSRTLGKGRVDLPLELDAQQVEHVAARQDLVQIVGHLDAQLFPALRDQRRRTADDHVRPQLLQAPDVRAGGAAVGDVADQGHGQPCDAAQPLANRQDVEQALRGMFVRRRRRR